jgi:hypothetical protein
MVSDQPSPHFLDGISSLPALVSLVRSRTTWLSTVRPLFCLRQMQRASSSSKTKVDLGSSSG